MSLLCVYGGLMLNKREYGYRVKMIARLEEELKQLKEDNAMLLRENKVLQTRLDSTTKALDQAEAAFQAYVETYKENIAQASDARKTYEALSRECMEVKAEYSEQMKKLIGDASRASRLSK